MLMAPYALLDYPQRGIVANLAPAVYACRILGSRHDVPPILEDDIPH
jgi:hypothetical protein